MPNFSWAPHDVNELILYLAIVVIIVVLIRLFHYNSIQRKVVTTSRCLREKTQGKRGGIYSVKASNHTNDPMYSVHYDLNAKSYSVECACKEGKTVNAFTDIPVYDLRDPGNPHKTIAKKYCQCDKYLTTNPRVYFTGYPGIVRYMNNKDPSFFDTNY